MLVGTLVDVGWLPAAPMSVCAQVLAALLVVGSYVAAEWLKVRAPLRRGRQAAQRAVEPASL